MQNPDALPRETIKTKTAKFYVATFSDMGIAVYHYNDPLIYGRAVQAAMGQHNRGEVDTYTYGAVA